MPTYTVIGLWENGELLIAGVAEGEVRMVDSVGNRFADYVTADSPAEAEREVLASH